MAQYPSFELVNLQSRSRREFFAATVGMGAGWMAQRQLPAAPTASSKKKVAGVVTIYRPNSHADVILTKILQGWKHDGGLGPNLELVSLYVDQFPADDMSVGFARQHGFRMCRSIREALTLGGSRLAVDGVISIGEHGDYPYNELGQHLYPRRRFFQEILDTFSECGSVVPVFNDKHPGPQWDDAQWMYRRARELNVPWMAGSSAPVGYRTPDVTLAWGAEVKSCLAIGYSGLDIYGIHTLEFLQSIVERRARSERGIQFVHCRPLADVQPLIAEGLIDAQLLKDALECAQAPSVAIAESEHQDTALFVVGYRDGLVVPVLMLAGSAKAITAAVKTTTGDQVVTRFDERTEPRYPHFACLLKGIESMIHTGQPAYPVERNMLTAGALDRLMTSRHQGFRRLETPELAIAYQPVDYAYGDHLKL
ncbi:MAG: hypothetical protein KF752_14650 [Pirellulaceae bacterium]|nr:hypothetical protein [Pirellulaceae bacterium]